MPDKSVYGAIRFLAALREVDPFIPTQMAECLLTVALQPGLTMSELSDRTGLAQSSCSRNIAALSKWHRLGKEGHDLVEAMEDPHERRRKIIFLTPKGAKVVQKAIQQLVPGFELKSLSARDHVNRIYSGG